MPGRAGCPRRYRGRPSGSAAAGGVVGVHTHVGRGGRRGVEVDLPQPPRLQRGPQQPQRRPPPGSRPAAIARSCTAASGSPLENGPQSHAAGCPRRAASARPPDADRRAGVHDMVGVATGSTTTLYAGERVPAGSTPRPAGCQGWRRPTTTPARSGGRREVERAAARPGRAGQVVVRAVRRQVGPGRRGGDDRGRADRSPATHGRVATAASRPGRRASAGIGERCARRCRVATSSPRPGSPAQHADAGRPVRRSRQEPGRPAPVLSAAVAGARRPPLAGRCAAGIVIHSRRQTAPSQRRGPQRSVYQTRLVPTAERVTAPARRSGPPRHSSRRSTGPARRDSPSRRRSSAGRSGTRLTPAVLGPDRLDRLGHEPARRPPGSNATPPESPLRTTRRQTPSPMPHLGAVVLHAGEHRPRRQRVVGEEAAARRPPCPSRPWRRSRARLRGPNGTPRRRSPPTPGRPRPRSRPTRMRWTSACTS